MRYTFTSASATLRKLEFRLGRLRRRLDGGDFRQRNRLAGEILDGLTRIGEAIFHARVLHDRLGRFAQAVEHLSHDVHGLPLVGTFLFSAGLLVDVFGFSHLAGHFEHLIVLSQREMPVSDDVPEAVEIIAVFVALRELRGGGDYRLVLLEFQHRIRQRERRLIGGGIFRISGEKLIEHHQRLLHQIDARDFLLA